MVQQKKIERFIPNLSGLVDPKAEVKFNQTFLRLYEYFEARFLQDKEDLRKELLGEVARLPSSNNDISSLIGIFSQPLVGSNQTDPLIQSLTQSFSSQDANSFFAGPTPSFRTITIADLPPEVVNQNPITILDWLAQ